MIVLGYCYSWYGCFWFWSCYYCCVCCCCCCFCCYYFSWCCLFCCCWILNILTQSEFDLESFSAQERIGLLMMFRLFFGILCRFSSFVHRRFFFFLLFSSLLFVVSLFIMCFVNKDESYKILLWMDDTLPCLHFYYIWNEQIIFCEKIEQRSTHRR